MNQNSSIAFGTDATRLSGYAQTANERLGALDLVFENTGRVPAYIRVKRFVSAATLPSGYTDVQPTVTGVMPGGVIGTSVGPEIYVRAGGVVTRSYNLLSQRIGFFGSGVAGTVTVGGVSTYVTSTTVNISAVLRNKADLRGAQIDIAQVGRQAWGYDQAMNTPILTKKWGSIDSSTGVVNPTGNNYNEPASS